MTTATKTSYPYTDEYGDEHRRSVDVITSGVNLSAQHTYSDIG